MLKRESTLKQVFFQISRGFFLLSLFISKLFSIAFHCLKDFLFAFFLDDSLLEHIVVETATMRGTITATKENSHDHTINRSKEESFRMSKSTK